MHCNSATSLILPNKKLSNMVYQSCTLSNQVFRGGHPVFQGGQAPSGPLVIRPLEGSGAQNAALENVGKRNVWNAICCLTYSVHVVVSCMFQTSQQQPWSKADTETQKHTDLLKTTNTISVKRCTSKHRVLQCRGQLVCVAV